MKNLFNLIYNSENPLPNYYELGQTELNWVIRALHEQNVRCGLRTCGEKEFTLDIEDTDITVRLLKIYKGYWLGLLTIVDATDFICVKTFLSAEDVTDYLKEKGVLS